VPACVRLLGPVEVDGPDGAVRLGGAKERRLLVALALQAGHVVAEDGLVAALWDDAPPRTATKTLQNYVLRVRRALGRDGAASIVTRPGGYLLAGVSTDAARAEDLVDRARRCSAAGEHAAALAGFDEALALWRGAALAEFAGHAFARAEAARLTELRETAREDRVATLLALGRHREAVAAGEALVAERPLRERRWAQLMLALYRDGRQADALAAHRRLRATLAEQLGVDPGPAVRELEAAILAHRPALAAAAPDAGAPRPSTPCFGRERELDRLRDRLEAAARGQGGVVLVHGEPGIGKSRLLGEVGAAAAARGVEVLAGRCLEGAGAPYAPFAEALGPLGDGGTDDLRPDERRLRLLDGVARDLFARAAQRPVLLLLDDLHWADDGTVSLLRHVARTATDGRLLVIGTYRTGEVGAGHPLDDALGALGSESESRSLRLGGLDRDAIETLLVTTAGAQLVPDLVAEVCAETGGNPFFAREVVRQLAEDGALHADAAGRLETALPLAGIPDGVRHVIARRRRRLSHDANRLLDAAAGIEGPFPYDVVRTVAGLDEDRGLAAIDVALAAGLVVPDLVDDRYDFTHALVRHAVDHALNPSRRLRRHRDLARALDAARAAGARVAAAEVARQYHRSAALPGAEAGVAPALDAAARAAALGVPDEQATHLAIARELMGPDDPRRTDVTGELALARAWALHFDAAVAETRTVLAAGAGADLAARVATALAGAGSTRHAWTVAADGLGRVDPARDAPETVAILTLFDHDRREADHPDHPGMHLDLPGRRAALGVLHASGRLAGRGDLGRYAVAAIHGARVRVPEDAAADPTVAAYLVGDYAAAVPAFARAADEAEARGRLALAVYCRAGQARCEIALGALDTPTLPRVRELVARAPDLPLGWQLLHHQGAEDALAMARDEGWDERAAAFAPWARPGPGQHWGIAAITAIVARIEAHRGDEARAMGLLARPVRALTVAPAWAPNYTRTACEVAETLWLLGRHDHAAVVESAIREKALGPDFRFPMTDVRQALGRLCALDGRPGEARAWFDRAREVLDAQGARPLRGIVDHDEAVMAHRRGEGTRPAADRAAAAFAELGMTGWRRRLPGR
jgi:DNA-binding SARP family transcriptional activator